MTESFSPSAPAAPDYRKTLSRVGWGMAVFFAAGQLGQMLVAFVLRLLAPDFAATALALFLITDLGLYGIGLPLARSIARGQQGDVTAENTPEGPLFRLRLFR